MSNWAVSAAAKLVEQENMIAETWSRALQRHQMLAGQAPGLWVAIREALQAQIQAFNECVGKEVVHLAPTTEDKLTASSRTEIGRRSMTAVFDAKTSSILSTAYSLDGEVDFQERYVMALNFQDNAAIATPSGVERTPEQLAAHMLDGLMGWK